MIATLERLTTKLASMPHEDDVAAPNERERVFEKRQQLNTLHSKIKFLSSQIAKCDDRLNAKHVRPWRDVLISLRTEFQQQLAALEATPPADRRAKEKATQAANGLRDVLEIITHGTVYIHGDLEAMPGTLWQALIDRGFGPEPGQRTIFMGRGGLVLVEAKITSLEAERALLVQQLDRAVEQAERVLAT